MRGFGIKSSIRGYGKSFRDTFSRSDGDVGRAQDGTRWDPVRGSWSVISNKLATTSKADSYPLNAVGVVSKNVDITLKDISQGVMAALWVTDSGNWWGLGIDQVTLNADNNNASGCDCATCTNTNYNSYYYGCGTNYCTGANYYYCCNVVGNRYCTGYNTSNCNKWCSAPWRCCGGYNGSNCRGYNSGNCNENPPYCVSGYYSYACGTNYCVGYSVAGYYNYTCNCVTCYPQYVRLIQSASNTISTIASDFINNSKIIRSMKLLVRGSQVTAKLYENADLTGQIGSDLVYNPTGVALTPKYGIMIKPSSYSQGSTSGEIQIDNV